MGLPRRRLRSGSWVGHWDVSWFENGKEIGYTYNSGWIGLRSVPITLAEGNSQAESAVRISHSMGG